MFSIWEVCDPLSLSKDESLNILTGAPCFFGQERTSIPHLKRPDISEVKERVLQTIRTVFPHVYDVGVRRIRQVGKLWMAEGSYRSEGKESPSVSRLGCLADLRFLVLDDSSNV